MSGLGAMMAGGNPDDKRGRDPDEWYATPKEATRALLRVMPLGLSDHIWEPCCGDGAMSKIMEAHGPRVLSTDIKTRDYGTEQDFFETKLLPEGITGIITNPPWNRAEEFVRHAILDLKVANMALLLKATWWHAHGRQKLWNDCRPCMIMPLTWRLDFKGLGRPTMECSWMIWDKNAPKSLPGPFYVPLNKE
jgi:hypothetical protein